MSVFFLGGTEIVRPNYFTETGSPGLTNDKMRTSVFSPGGFIMTRIQRTLFAVTDRTQTGGADAQVNQEVHGAAGTPFAQGDVIFGGTTLVTVAFNQYRGAGVSAQPGGFTFKDIAGVRRQNGLIKSK